MATFTKKQIQQVVENIMILEGPDGHIDGSEIITNFIIAVNNKQIEKWIRKYESTFESKKEKFNFHCVEKIFE